MKKQFAYKIRFSTQYYDKAAKKFRFGGQLTYCGNNIAECVIKAMTYWQRTGSIKSFRIHRGEEPKTIQMRDYVRSLDKVRDN